VTPARRDGPPPPPRRASKSIGTGSHDAHDPSCRLVFILAEGLRHIADRRARETGRRGTMRLLRPARPTDTTMKPARTRSRRRHRIAS
jgi:hypothetical protein